MPRRVEISTCLECPYQCNKKGENALFCNALNSYIEADPTIEVDERCPLEEVRIGDNKEDHKAAVKHIYQILQKKGMNEDSLHDANTYFNQYLKDQEK